MAAALPEPTRRARRWALGYWGTRVARKAIKDADQHAYDAVIDGAQWKRYVMTLRAKVETYNDVSKLKVHIFRASPVNYANEGKTLLAAIAKYNLPPPPEPRPPPKSRPSPPPRPSSRCRRWRCLSPPNPS